MFGQCVWHCPQQSVACVHCYLLHSSFQHIASADQSTKFHRLMFWGGREMDVIVTLNSRPFLINMDSTQRTTHMTIFEGRQWWGGRDNQKEIKDWSLDRTAIYFPLLISMWQHCVVVQFVHDCPKSTSPQWPSSSPESTWMINMTTLERGIENSTPNTITSHLLTPFSMKGNKKLHGVLSDLKLIFRTRKLNLHVATIAIVCYPSYQTVSIDSTIVDTTLLSVLLQAV